MTKKSQKRRRAAKLSRWHQRFYRILLRSATSPVVASFNNFEDLMAYLNDTQGAEGV